MPVRGSRKTETVQVMDSVMERDDSLLSDNLRDSAAIQGQTNSILLPDAFPLILSESPEFTPALTIFAFLFPSFPAPPSARVIPIPDLSTRHVTCPQSRVLLRSMLTRFATRRQVTRRD